VASRQCAKCKAPLGEDKELYSCAECGHEYCPDCAKAAREEATKLRLLREGDPRSRLAALCPHCHLEVFRVGD